MEEIKVFKSGDGCMVQIHGRFTFNTNKEFRRVYDCLADKPLNVSVSLANTTYVDSSALGMLLMLRDKAAAVNAEVKLTGAYGDVLKVLNIACFGKLFKIN